jgi:MFS family permease
MGIDERDMRGDGTPQFRIGIDDRAHQFTARRASGSDDATGLRKAKADQPLRAIDEIVERVHPFRQLAVKLPLLADKGGWVWVIVGLAAAPSCFLWDRVADAVGQVRALMMAFGLQMVSVLMPIATDHALLNVGGAMLFGATFVGIVSLTLTLIGRCFPANPAKAMARMTLSYGVAQIIAPAMAGYIATASGSYRGALVVTALVMGCGVVALQALIHEEKRAAHQAVGAR